MSESAADPLHGMSKDEQRAWTSDITAVGHRDRADGTRLVIRRHSWGFSETVLRRGENGRWQTVTHVEHSTMADTTNLRAALTEAREFVDNHSEPWYLAGQRLLKTIDEALK